MSSAENFHFEYVLANCGCGLETWEPQEKISLEDCIRAYTSGSAYAQFEEGKKGELKAGEYADYVILSNDLTKVPPAQFTKTRVLRTVVGGRTVYAAD